LFGTRKNVALFKALFERSLEHPPTAHLLPNFCIPLQERISIQRLAGIDAVISGMIIISGAPAAEIGWSKVDQAIGNPGINQPGGFHKYSLSRSDLQVSVDGVALRPMLSLGS
jgi:hypothetical protein